MSQTLETPKPKEDTRVEEDWFDNVENLRPLRGGRRAGTLNEIASGAIRISSEVAEQKFRADFELAQKHEDPLSVMWNFANWFEEHFPTGKHRIFYPMLYKICTTYAIIDRYKNDERMLKLWLKLAESFPESALAVMQFAYTKGSCRQLAKFYIRWSEMYQAIGYLHRAREKLELGISTFATPLPLLHTALDAVKRQIEMNTSAVNGNDTHNTSALGFFADSVDRTVEDCRETLGKLRGLGRQHAAPIIRITHGPPGRVSQSAQRARLPPAAGGSASMASAAAPFEIFADESPAPSVFQKMVSSTPMVRRRLVDDLSADPDYQALFGFFDDREKLDLQFSTLENSSKPACKFASSASARRSNRRGLRNLGVRAPRLDFEVFDEGDMHNTDGNDQIKEEDEEALAAAAAAEDDVGGGRADPHTKTPVTAAPKKARLCMKRPLVEEMSVEEAYAKRLAHS